MQKIIAKPINKNYKKDCHSIIGIFLKMRKLKKEITLTLEIIRNKNMSDNDRERRKEYMKNYYDETRRI